MKIKLGAILSAAITLIIFTVLPLYSLGFIPQEVNIALADVGINLTAFLNQIAMIGVAMTIITIVKGIMDQASPVYLVMSVASSIATLVLTLVAIGLGNIGSFGVTTITQEMEEGTNSVVVDLRLFLQITVLTVGLKVVHSVLKFRDAQKERTQLPIVA